MRLTLQMKKELISVHAFLNYQLHVNYLAEFVRKRDPKYMEEFSKVLYQYKIKLEQWLSETDVKKEKYELLRLLLEIEGAYTGHRFDSDDFDRYSKMGLKIEPNDAFFNLSRGWYLMERHNKLPANTPPTDWDYIDYFRKAYEYENKDCLKQNCLLGLRKAEAKHDFYTGLIKEIKHLEQLDPTPNIELKEAKWEVYKVTISNSFQCYNGYSELDGQQRNLRTFDHICNHRVLFQNAEGNINMGAWFDDPVRDRVRNHDFNRARFSCTIFVHDRTIFIRSHDFHYFIDFSLEHIEFLKFFLKSEFSTSRKVTFGCQIGRF